MTEHIGTLIVGAGPTGLGAAWRLSQLGRSDWLLCEATAVAGGLAASVIDEHGFTWDLGGHVQFSHYDYFDALMDDLLGPDRWLHHQRQSWVWLGATFVPYPFQLNLHRLPAAERDECLRGLQAVAGNGHGAAPEHFGAWIDATFGAGIARLFLRPYNTKVWAYPPEELSCRWVGDRVAVVDVGRVIDNIATRRDDVSWGPNTRFRFPLHGGTGSVWTALAQRLGARYPRQLRLREELTYLDTAARTAHFAGGQRVRYERLLSSAPLDRLVQGSDLAAALATPVAALKHSSTHIIGVGLHGQPAAALAGKCWMYFPEPAYPFYRVTVFSHYSPHNVPDAARYWSLMAEVSESPLHPVDAAAVVQQTVQGMVRAQLIPGPQAVHHTWHRRLEHGYPTPSRSRDSALATILPALEARGVYSRGRFGAWKYEVSNQDHSFAQGVEVVDRWISGAREVTLHEPDTVNARRSRG